MKKYKSCAIAIVFILFLSSGSTLFSKEQKFSVIEPEKISQYKIDRIVFQRIEKKKNDSKDDFIENYTVTKDNSVENLLIIKDKKIHFIADGFDSISDVQKFKILSDSANKYVPDNDYWVNKINGKPDYIRVLYRRSDILINSNEEFVTTNFGAFYKSTRDKLIKMHVDKFRMLLTNKRESDLKVEKRLMSYSVNPGNSNDIKQKFYFSAKAKSIDGTIYFCEDADGDGITETFTASRDDGFDWGINSGPNLLCIIGNTDKELETIIGKLVKESIYGLAEEEKKAAQEVVSEKDIINLIDEVAPMDKFYE